MGFAEVADYARNFAVMVRVQGPDPKGMKMRNHAFHHYNSGNTTVSASGMILGASSTSEPFAAAKGGSNSSKLSSSTALVLTVASIIEPFILQKYRENLSNVKPQLIPGAQIHILVERKTTANNGSEVAKTDVLHWLPATLLRMINIPASASAVRSLIEASSGAMEHGWEVGWSLASHNSGPQDHTQVEQFSFRSQRHMLGLESSNPSHMGQSTTRIALLAVSSKLFEDLPEGHISISKKRGDLLLAMGSPFGILSPVHFFNNISVGSIANTYPPDSSSGSLLMADIRCLPGMEGSPVFGEQAQLVGLLTRPLRQKISGAELQLVIPWEAIASVCSDLLQEEPQITWKGMQYNSGNLNAVGKLSASGFHLDGSSYEMHDDLHSDSLQLSPIEKATKSICLITTDDGSWASGVLLNKEGLVLTNAHLLEPWRFGKAVANGVRNETKSKVIFAPSSEYLPSGHEIFCPHESSHNMLPTKLKTVDISPSEEDGVSRHSLANISHRSIRVRLGFSDPWIWSNASIIYVSKGPLDIALLQLENTTDQLWPVVMDFTSPSPGSQAYVIGHGLFGPRCDILPSAGLGVIAKVIEVKRPGHGLSEKLNMPANFPAMLQTTAAVHPGGSGGAVVNSGGHMIGLVTSNARHGGGTVIPHLNFSIPCAALEPIFKFSRDMKDFSLLEDLDKPDERLSSVWALMPPLSPKPGPSFPDLPQLREEDNERDVKGSRFAKFITERQGLLKKAAEIGHEKSSPSKVLPSKL